MWERVRELGREMNQSSACKRKTMVVRAKRIGNDARLDPCDVRAVLPGVRSAAPFFDSIGKHSTS